MFKIAVHKHTLSYSLPRIKNIQDPSTLSSVHLVLGSLIQQISIKYLYIQADTSLSSWSLYFRSPYQDSYFPQIGILFMMKYILKAPE